MKINMQNDETYDINIPEEVDSREFIALLERLSKIVRLVKLSELGSFKEFKDNSNQRISANQEKKKGTYKEGRVGTVTWYDTREKALDLLQYGYHGTSEDRRRIEKIMDMGWAEINKRFHNLRLRYDIKPNEIGIMRWRGVAESRKVNLRLPNWVIKSYTGIFDENGNN